MSTLWDDVKNYIPSNGSYRYVFFEDDSTVSNGEEVTGDTIKYGICIGVFLLLCAAYIIFRFARKKYRENI